MEVHILKKYFLPREVWEGIKDNFRMYIYISELDGKHSEVKANIEVDVFTENELTKYQSSECNDGERLFEFIYEYLDIDKYDYNYLQDVQNEVSSLCQVESMTIKFNKKDKEVILDLLNEYLL